MSSAVDELIEDFELLPDWEERYRYLIELGRALPAMEDALKTPATKVSGCASQVWIHSRFENGVLKLAGDSDALIVKGLIAVAFAMFNQKSPADIDRYDYADAFRRLGLTDHITPQRSNGFAAMIARIKSDAARLQAG